MNPQIYDVAETLIELGARVNTLSMGVLLCAHLRLNVYGCLNFIMFSFLEINSFKLSICFL